MDQPNRDELYRIIAWARQVAEDGNDRKRFTRPDLLKLVDAAEFGVASLIVKGIA